MRKNLYSQLSNFSDEELKIMESKNNDFIIMLDQMAIKLKDESFMYLKERNYRKYFTTISNLKECQEKLIKIITDPKSSESDAKKASDENIRLEKSIYHILRYGEHLDGEQDDIYTLE